MGIFSGLEALGFKTENREVFEEPEFGKKEEEVASVEKKEETKEEDYLFPKTYKCPICDKSYKSLAVKTGKARSIGQDDDLRPRYKGIDPLKYDAIVCPTCGYSALARYYESVMPVQAKRLRVEVMPKFKGIELSTDKYSYQEAITHYKMVLMCDVIGGVPTSRRAYTCLKMAWVLRGWIEAEGKTMSAEEKKEIAENHKECIQNAYDGFMKAFSSEKFPMCGMDEMTVSFLVAQLAFSLGDYQSSYKMIMKILENKNVSYRLKDKTLELKEKIREKLKG